MTTRPTRRLTAGQFVRERLITAGRRGTTQSDLHQAYRAIGRKMTYASFTRFFHFLKQLDYVEVTGKTEPGIIKGTEIENVLSDRVFYRISETGQAAEEESWADPLTNVYQQFKRREPSRRERIQEVGRTRRSRTSEGEPLRRIPRARGPVSVRLNEQLRSLTPQVEALRADFATEEQLNALDAEFISIVDAAINAQERAGAQESLNLQAILDRLGRVSEAIDNMKNASKFENRVSYLRAYEIVRSCCD
jgi:hypothetical protein